MTQTGWGHVTQTGWGHEVTRAEATVSEANDCVKLPDDRRQDFCSTSVLVLEENQRLAPQERIPPEKDIYFSKKCRLRAAKQCTTEFDESSKTNLFKVENGCAFQKEHLWNRRWARHMVYETSPSTGEAGVSLPVL